MINIWPFNRKSDKHVIIVLKNNEAWYLSEDMDLTKDRYDALTFPTRIDAAQFAIGMTVNGLKTTATTIRV